MAKLFHMRPMLWVDDVKATIDWYVKTLDFEEGNYVETWQWSVVKKDDVLIMLAKPNEHTAYDGPKFTGSLYINTDDVDSLWKKLKGNSYIYYGLDNFEYGMREFAIKDCNGYILQFGQDLLHEEDN
jgi:uncharacterized glyoxalase superfamily protein PhnB